MGSFFIRGEPNFSRLRDLLRGSHVEEGHNVFYQPHMVKRP